MKNTYTNSISYSNKNVSLNRSVNDTYKNSIKFGSSSDKHQVIFELRKYNYRTPPKTIAIFLETLFSNWPSQDGHWLYIAQHYAPRPINRVIEQIVKEHQRGDKTINNPAAYFTYLIKFRRQRKCFRRTNGGREQQIKQQ